MICDLRDSIRCHRCLRTAAAVGVLRECVGAGLGDMVASGLEKIGITKDRVSALVGGDCGCQKRQEALNAFGRRLGIGVNSGREEDQEATIE